MSPTPKRPNVSKQQKVAKAHWDYLESLSNKTGVKKHILARNWRAINEYFGGNLKSLEMAPTLMVRVHAFALKLHAKKEREKKDKQKWVRKNVKKKTSKKSEPKPTKTQAVNYVNAQPGPQTVTKWEVTVSEEKPQVTLQVDVDEDKLANVILALRAFPSVGDITILEGTV